jgi:hypothetical protein
VWPVTSTRRPRQKLLRPAPAAAIDLGDGPLVLAHGADVEPVVVGPVRADALARIERAQHEVGELARPVGQVLEHARLVHVDPHANRVVERGLLAVAGDHRPVEFEHPEVDVHPLALHGDREQRPGLAVCAISAP